MNRTDNHLFGDDDIRHAVRAEVAAYHREDVVHNILQVGTCALLLLIAVAIVLKACGAV